MCAAHPERGTATFRELDPDLQQSLDNFRASMLGRCDGLAEAWKSYFDTANLGRVNEEDFVRAVESEGFASKNPKKMFQALKPQKFSNSINEQDFKSLLTGLPTPEERELAWVGSRGLGE